MIGELIAHYRVIEKLGAGGMGEVYLAEDTKLKRKVALKFLPQQYTNDSDTKARFQREAEALAALNHPHIVTVFEVSEHEGNPFIAMEYVEGQSLKQRIQSGDISFDQFLGIATQICDGLAAAHEEKIVHRDIKSDNIILSSKSRIKVMDFGLATWRGVASITQASSTLGTMAYMSPEQAQGGEVDPRSDLFSLGVVFYELLTGKLPFAGEHEAAVVYSIINENPHPLERYRSGLPAGLQEVVDKLLDKDPETRYQSAAGVAADLKRLKKGSDPRQPVYTGPAPDSAPRATTTAPPPRKSRTGIVVSATVLAIAVLVLLVFKPWKIVVQPTDEAMALENRLAVLYFDNLADPADKKRLGEITASLLISDLSASQYVQVVSDQRLYDILKLLGHEGARTVDRQMASQVAERAGARWMLTGNILRSEPNFELTAQLIDVETGNVLASPRISGAEGEDVFVLVDRLSAEIRGQLSLPSAAAVEEDPSVISLTTSSTEAYGHYLRGWEYYYQYKMRDAEREFRSAIEADSSFVQAYYGLSFVATSTEPRYRLEVIGKAMERVEGLGEKERLLIEARSEFLNERQDEAIAIWEKLVARYPDEKEAYLRLASAYRSWPRNNYEKSVELFNRVIQIDPLFKDAYNNMAYDYSRLGDMEKSIWAINKYIELAPDEPNPYDTRAELYGFNGQLDLAIESYQKALEIDSTFVASGRKLAYCYLLKQNYAAADSLFQRGATHTDRATRSAARRGRVSVPAFQGRLMEALRRANAAAEADVIEYGDEFRHRLPGHVARGRAFEDLAKLYEEQHWYDSLQMIESILAAGVAVDTSIPWLKPSGLRRGQFFLAVDMGEFARADSIYQLVEADLDTTTQEDLSNYISMRSYLELERGNYDAAIPLFLRDLAQQESSWDYLRLGRAYLGAGSIGKAVEMLERALNRHDGARLYDGVESVRMHFWLAQAYEQSGWTDKAIEQYEIFLDKWKDADPEIKILGEARESLARLKGA